MPITPLGSRIPLKLRAGVDVPALLGMVRQGTPATIPDAAFNYLENVRFAGPKIVSRPGQQKATNQVTGPIEGFHDTSDIGAAAAADSSGGGGAGGRYIYFLGFGPNGNGSFSESSLVRVDTTAVSVAIAAIGPRWDGVTPYYNIIGIIAGSDGLLYACGSLCTPLANPALEPALTRPVVIQIVPSTMTVTQVSLLAGGAPNGLQPAFTGFSLLEDPASPLTFFAGTGFRQSAVYSGSIYRGVSIDDATVLVTFAYGDVEATVASLSGTVYAGWGGPGITDTIRKRVASGNWTNLTLPAAPNGTSHLGVGKTSGGSVDGNAVVYNSRLYMTGVWHDIVGSLEQRLILSIRAGDIVTIEHIISVDTDPLQLWPAQMALFNGKLYYIVYDNGIGSANTALGRYDGATWTDLHWNAHIGGVYYHLINIFVADAAGDSLYAMAANDVTGQYWIIKSNAADTTSWSTVIRFDDVIGAFGAGIIPGTPGAVSNL